MVACREQDLADRSFKHRTGLFQRVLLDAPCSGLGTLRRNPDIKWASDRSELGRYSHTQSTLLEAAAQQVAPGGVLVYAVCSPEPEETVDVVRRFLENHPGFRLDGDLRELPEAVQGILGPQGFLQTYPHLSYMDGFFAARMKFQP
jgi:16S rRNA (cytosine967-C5)-methyltransferase